MIPNLLAAFFNPKRIGNDLPEQGGIMGNGVGFYPQTRPTPDYRPGDAGMGADPLDNRQTTSIFPQKNIQDVASPVLSAGGDVSASTASPTPDIPSPIGFYPQQNRIPTGGGSMQDTPAADLPTASAVVPPPMSERARRDAETAGWANKTPEERRDLAIKGDAPVEHSALKRFLMGAGRGALMGLASGGGIGGAIGGAAAGSIGEGFFPSVNRKINAQQELGKATNEINVKRQDQKVADDAAYRKAQTENIYADNKRLEEEGQERSANRQTQASQRARDSWFRTHKYFDPEKATEADKTALAQFGETPESVGKYDHTNAKVRVSGGVQFQFDPITRTWNDTGIPPDKSKGVVDISVVDPTTGEESTYSTTSDKAASIKAGLAKTGMQIKAENARHTETINMQGKKLEAKKQEVLDKIQSGDKKARQTLIAKFKTRNPQATDEEVQQFINSVIPQQ
jgi:hypothetical protein